MILFVKHVEIEGPETLGTFFKKKGVKVEIINLHNGDRLPETPTGIDAVVSLGGPMNVYEETEYPFLQEEDVFIKNVLKWNIPFLGICLGSQLLSKAAGGKVVRSPKQEIGWFTVDVTPAGRVDPLLSGLPNPLEVFQWHGDMCLPPPEAVLLASSAGCPVQAFRLGTKAYGLQFHAEITDKSIRDWSADFPMEKMPQRDEMLEHYNKISSVFLWHGQLLCENFLKVIKS